MRMSVGIYHQNVNNCKHANLLGVIAIGVYQHKTIRHARSNHNIHSLLSMIHKRSILTEATRGKKPDSARRI